MDVMSLTQRKVNTLPAGRYRDRDLRGLYLHVGPNSRSWILRYERDGRERMMGLGSTSEFTLSEARERARAARQQLADGIDPIEARRSALAAAEQAEANRLTFEVAASRYHDQHAGKWGKQHRSEFLSSLRRYAFKAIGSLEVSTITVPNVLAVIEPIWNKKSETASRVRARIESVLDWAKARGHRAGDNPASWDVIGQVLPAVADIAPAQHHSALPFDEIGQFMVELRARDGIGARALEFAILTAARSKEAMGAQWSEIDLDGAIWTVPANRMKAGREHRVPLSSAVIELLKALPREQGNQYLFPGRDPGSRVGVLTLSRTLSALRPDVTVHGMRATFSTWASETTAFASHVIEQALAHKIGNAVEAAYKRGDLFEKRRRLMNDWATYCAAPPVAGAVIPIGRGR
jgi:integrase